MRLVIEDGKIEFGGNTLIEHINFDINNNDKIAIIGKNGCGKTSLLKVIQGELDLTFDHSMLNCQFYLELYLNQLSQPFPSKTVRYV